ncbi:SRPBCC family protein [Amycolatopsis taiwanensis]|uniref:Carbon monoxide dehydrogenase n=1 Tax=Amycolatopsis taiwanensis TaxID=342230 RepID=A0A9W6VJ49_9PSEU|nr:SRPBCC family protein [Amycolatopsis taiwanensis]GLY70355.1 hypothetical protein Atai01_69740 [Amycolatopsis taiwanensis]
MRLHHEFTLPVPPEQAWHTLLDVPRVARCLPGATLDRVDGDEFSGRVMLKVGPLRMAYLGDVRITERDETARRLVLSGAGKEFRGSGTAEANVTAALEHNGAGTLVALDTELALTGRAAQFGRGLVNEVAGDLIGQFADRLSVEMRNGGEPAPELPPEPVAAPATAGPAGESLDHLAMVRPLLASRAAAVAGGLVALALAFVLGRLGRRR